ncbi:MAG: substrate-binding domain-containing protein [Bacteroidales bacterium]
MKIRIKDIARLAQVSPGTVDRVIHNRGEVSEKTREKIQNIIQELNYQPDILARVLASKKNFIFSVLMPVSVNENDFWNSPSIGIDKAIVEVAPFGVEVKRYLFNQFDAKSFLSKSSQILDDNPDAILFAPVFPAESIDFIHECKSRDIPLMLFNSNLEEAEEMLYIGQNALQSGYLAAKLLHYGMHDDSSILIVNIAGRKDNHNHILRRERGFRKYFADNEQENVNIYTIDCILDNQDCLSKQFESALERFRARSVFVTNSRVYMVADYLKSIGESKIKLLGYDLLPQNVDALKSGWIDFLISQKPEEQGYKGIMTLFNKLILKRDVEVKQYIPIDIITKENIDYYEYK